MVKLKCACGDNRYVFTSDGHVNLAKFLRDAVDDGWRRINEEPVKAVEADGMTDIVLSGTCTKCDRRQPSLLDRVFRRNTPAKVQKAS